METNRKRVGARDTGEERGRARQRMHADLRESKREREHPRTCGLSVGIDRLFIKSVFSRGLPCKRLVGLTRMLPVRQRPVISLTHSHAVCCAEQRDSHSSIQSVYSLPLLPPGGKIMVKGSVTELHLSNTEKPTLAVPFSNSSPTRYSAALLRALLVAVWSARPRVKGSNRRPD